MWPKQLASARFIHEYEYQSSPMVRANPGWNNPIDSEPSLAAANGARRSRRFGFRIRKRFGFGSDATTTSGGEAA